MADAPLDLHIRARELEIALFGHGDSNRRVHDLIEAALMRERGELETLRALVTEAMLMLGASHSASDNYEAKAEAFYRDTGMMAPGKDQPAAMGGDNYTQRAEAWAAWRETKLADLRDRIVTLTTPEPSDAAR